MLIGKLLAQLGIDTGEYTKGLDAAERKTKTSVASIGKKLAALGGKAIVGGLGKIDEQTIMFIGQQKGINTKMRQ